MEPKKFDKRISKTIALAMALLLASTTLTGCNWWKPRQEEDTTSSSVELEVPEPDAKDTEEQEEQEPEVSAEVDPDLKEEPNAELNEVVEEPQTAPEANKNSTSAEKSDTFIDSSTVFSNKNDKTKEAVTTSALMPETVVQPEQVTNVVYEPVGTSQTDAEQTRLLAEPTAAAPRATSGKSYTNARFKKKGNYSDSKVYKNGYVDVGAVTISNKTFTGDLYIDVSSGTVTLKNVEVQGSIYLNGGSDWVKLYDVQAGGLIVESSDTSRIFASRDTVVSGVTVKTDTILEEGGLYSGSDGFKNVVVNGAKGTTLTIKNLKLNQLKTKTPCNIVYDNDTVINYLYTEAATELYGYGQINRLYCSSNGVYYDSKPLYIETKSGCAAPSRRTSGSGSGSSSGSGSTENKKVTLYSISDQYLDVGSSKVVGIDHTGSSLKVTTSNASVAKVTYSTSKSRITMKGLKPGKATIKVTSSRSGYQSVTTSFQIIVKDNGSSEIQLSGIANQNLELGDVRYVNVNTDASAIRVSNTDDAVADVSVDGFQLRIRGKKAGTTTVKVTASRAGRISKSTTFRVTVRGSSIPDDYVQIRPIANQILPRGNVQIINVNTDGTSLKATSSDTSVAKVTARQDDTLVVEALNPGSSWITVTASRRGYQDNSVKFRVDVYGETISAPNVYLNLGSSSGLTYTSGTWTNQDVVFTLTGYNSSRTAYVYERPTGTTQWGNRQTVYNNRFVVTAEGAKDYYFFTRGSGGDSNATGIYTVCIDKTKPTVNVTDTANGTMKITATDSLSNILSVLIYNEKNEKFAPSYSGGIYTFRAPAAGNYRVVVTDQAGNVTTSGTYKLDGPTQPDTTAPVITVTQPENKWYNTDCKVAFTVTDDTAVSIVEISPKVPLSQTGSRYELTANLEGAVTYTITAKDAAGNPASQSLTVKLDKTAPTIDSVTTKEMQVEVKASDLGGSGVKEVRAVPTANPTATQVVTFQNGAYTFTAEKNVQYTITAIDQAGNVSAEKQLTIQDEPAPQPTVPTVKIENLTVTDSNTLTKSKWVEFDVEATLQKGQSLSVQLNGPDNKPQMPESIREISNRYRFEVTRNGIYTVVAQVKDASGKVIEGTTKTQQVTVSKIDSTAPAIVVTGNENGRITFTVTDETECTVTFDDQPNAKLSRVGNVQTHAVTGVGSGTYNITAIDQVGNQSTVSVIVSVPVKPSLIVESSTLYSTNKKDAGTMVKVDAHGSKLASITVDRSGASLQKDSENQYRFTATENGSYTIQAVSENGMSETLSLNVQGIQKEVAAPPSIQAGEQQANATFTEVTVPITVTNAQTVQADRGSLTGEKGSYKLTATENGSYTITAKNEDGNAVSVEVKITEVKGMIAPTIQTGSITVVGKTAQIPVTVDQNGGTAIVSVTDQNGAALASQGNGSYLFTATQNGSYTVTAKNAVGKTASAVVTVNDLDLTAPTISEPQVTYSADKREATILFTVVDPAEGKPSGVASVTFNGIAVQQTAEGYQTKVTENGSYTIIATDAAGNSSDKTVKVDGIDKQAPTIQQTSKNDSWAKQQVVTFSVTDENSGVQSVTVAKSSGTAVAVSESSGYSFTADENGTYTITAKDFAGNTATKDVLITKIDKTAPTAPKLMSGKKEVPVYNEKKNNVYGAKDTQTFNITYTKAAEGESPVSVKVKIDKEDYKTLPENQLTLKLKAGTHTVLIKTVDAAGNESSVMTYHFKVDSEQTAATPEKGQTEATEQKGDEKETPDSEQNQKETTEPSDPQPTK